MRHRLLLLLLTTALAASAQVGEHRSELAFGVSGGYVMSQVGFNPKVPLDQLGGVTAGVTVRYTSEKYFNSICAIVGELNLVQTGWKERILTLQDEPVVNPATGQAEAYSRKMNYLQVPVMARLGWGRERRGFQFFFQVGPQLGLFLSESTDANFDVDAPYMEGRTSGITAQYHMPVEHKLDYGIAGGVGLEFSRPHLGHILLDARYYYGLGDIYGNSKRDYFQRSNLTSIEVKLTYLFDLLRTNNSKIK